MPACRTSARSLSVSSRGGRRWWRSARNAFSAPCLPRSASLTAATCDARARRQGEAPQLGRQMQGSEYVQAGRLPHSETNGADSCRRHQPADARQVRRAPAHLAGHGRRLTISRMTSCCSVMLSSISLSGPSSTCTAWLVGLGAELPPLPPSTRPDRLALLLQPGRGEEGIREVHGAVALCQERPRHQRNAGRPAQRAARHRRADGSHQSRLGAAHLETPEVLVEGAPGGAPPAAA